MSAYLTWYDGNTMVAGISLRDVIGPVIEATVTATLLTIGDTPEEIWSGPLPETEVPGTYETVINPADAAVEVGGRYTLVYAATKGPFRFRSEERVVVRTRRASAC